MTNDTVDTIEQSYMMISRGQKLDALSRYLEVEEIEKEEELEDLELDDWDEELDDRDEELDDRDEELDDLELDDLELDDELEILDSQSKP